MTPYFLFLHLFYVTSFILYTHVCLEGRLISLREFGDQKEPSALHSCHGVSVLLWTPQVRKRQWAQGSEAPSVHAICGPTVVLGNKKSYFSLLELKAGEEFPNEVHISPQSILYEGLLFQIPCGSVILHLPACCQWVHCIQKELKRNLEINGFNKADFIKTWFPQLIIIF